MIPFDKNQQNKDLNTSVRIIGLGGAGSNMIERVALDGMEGAKLLTLNTDIRTLSTSVGSEKIQLGSNLTKGLGTGGDPDLGRQAASESEEEIRAMIKGHNIVFLCAGLGGGTGSGASPLVARIAREEGAFLVTFVTMPFPFEGSRRREQAETSLNELAALSSALVTFDNARMGELVLAKDGIHEAFAAGDRLISDSIKAITRLVVQPGLVNIGLDDLITALDTTRSRCLFGSGTASGQDRSQKALEKALTSPLLDQGSLLEDATTVLVHVCGGEDLTLFEVNVLMEELNQYTPENVHLLFGSAVDPSMKDALSVTIISALPEDLVQPNTKNAAAIEKPVIPAETASKNAAEESPETEKVAASEPVTEKDPEPETVEEVKQAEEETVFEDTESPEEKEAPDEELIIEEETNEEDAPEEPQSEKSTQDEDTSELANSEEKPFDEKPFDEEPTETESSNESKKKPQSELDLDGGPKGRFENAPPNYDNEGGDLDTPAFLRKGKKKRR